MFWRLKGIRTERCGVLVVHVGELVARRVL